MVRIRPLNNRAISLPGTDERVYEKVFAADFQYIQSFFISAALREFGDRSLNSKFDSAIDKGVLFTGDHCICVGNTGRLFWNERMAQFFSIQRRH